MGVGRPTMGELFDARQARLKTWRAKRSEARLVYRLWKAGQATLEELQRARLVRDQASRRWGVARNRHEGA